MKPGRGDKWAAFLLSLAVPGAGQLFARHWSCIAWFIAAAGLGAATQLLVAVSAVLAAVVNFLVLAVLGLASAEHAKRCLEPRPGRRRVTTRIDCGCGHGRAVRLRIELDIDQPADQVWTVVRDLERFACADPFHSRVVVLGPALRPGVDIALEHRAFGLTFWRFGRLLSWREGAGYAFSDLSAKGPRRGFPHVFFVRVLPGPNGGATLQVDVRGRWTARWLPLRIGRWWLRYVCQEHARLLRAIFSEELS